MTWAVNLKITNCTNSSPIINASVVDNRGGNHDDNLSVTSDGSGVAHIWGLPDDQLQYPIKISASGFQPTTHTLLQSEAIAQQGTYSDAICLNPTVQGGQGQGGQGQGGQGQGGQGQGGQGQGGQGQGGQQGPDVVIGSIIAPAPEIEVHSRNMGFGGSCVIHFKAQNVALQTSSGGHRSDLTYRTHTQWTLTPESGPVITYDQSLDVPAKMRPLQDQGDNGPAIWKGKSGLDVRVCVGYLDTWSPWGTKTITLQNSISLRTQLTGFAAVSPANSSGKPLGPAAGVRGSLDNDGTWGTLGSIGLREWMGL
jgi:hypothetical protein